MIRLSPFRIVRQVTQVVTLVAVLGLLSHVATAATPAAAPISCFDAVPVRTFQVDMEPAESSYSPGALVAVTAAVSRPPRDPAGLGQEVEPPVSLPAAGADVLIILKISGQEYVEFSRTNDQGEASVQIRLPTTAPAGPVPAVGYAWRVALRVPCVDVEEFGLVSDPDFVTIT